MKDLRDFDITYVKGIGPQKAQILEKELGIKNAYDLINHFPINYIDRRAFTNIKDLDGDEVPSIQLKGHFITFSVQGEGAKTRLTALFTDGTSTIEIVWFRRIRDIKKAYDLDKEYIIFGTARRFQHRWSMVHPEIDVPTAITAKNGFRSVYPLTEKLRNYGITSRSILTWIKNIFDSIKEIPEILPDDIIRKRNFPSRKEALYNIHFPTERSVYQKARERIKYEELFFVQLNILLYSRNRNAAYKGYNFTKIGDFFNRFYHIALPFQLTDAQKRVIKEIRNNMNTGRQMNRLIQGDVGSGKTLVALMVMLIAIDNGFQSCLMAPTEILAGQHYETLKKLAAQCGVNIALLTGSTKKKERDYINEELKNGVINILVGTHALIEENVQFKNLGLAVIDEQHRFGVIQRAKLWNKNKNGTPPHVLVMTATPIPRTLAMTVYGDLDVSVIDQLPPGRKPVSTYLRYESQRQQVYKALGEELRKGRQAYIVYPLIEDNEKLDLKSLEEGFELIKDTFPHYKVAMVHGRMKPAEKEWQMQLFASGEASILVATTVIEVGVNVPNATIMIIENAERFGLSQLHQLRGRVGRGAEKSHCILMTKLKIASETRKRLEIMTSTTDGFLIAEADLKIRGPGDLEGTLQSGIPFNLKMASLSQDAQIVDISRQDAKSLLEEDALLQKEKNSATRNELSRRSDKTYDFSRIS